MRFGSVCSGIEAASVAWEPLGWTPVFFSEIDPAPSRVLAHRFGSNMPGEPLATNGVPNYGDFTQIPESAGPIDLLVGGTPCQSFSVAGKRLGLDDPRGNLAIEYARLARRLGPRWIVWENVPGVLSSNDGRDFAAFIGLLVECGYGIAWRILDAQYVRVQPFARAVPQRRRRVFVVGHLGDWRPAATVLFEPEGLRGDPPPRRIAGQSAGPTLASRTRGGGGLGTDAECDGGLIAIGGFQDGTARGPVLSKWAKGSGGPAGDELQNMVAVAHSLRAEGHDASEDGTGRGVPLVAMPLKAHAGRGVSGDGADSETLVPVVFDCKGAEVATRDDGATPTLRAMGRATGKDNGGGQLAVAFTIHGTDKTASVATETEVAGSLRTKPPGAIENSSSTVICQAQDYVAFAENQRNEVREVAVAGAISTIRRGDAKNETLLAQSWAVRRLTPLECERLQGFPDGWTDVPGKGGKPMADGPRYKALGNSMAVNVMGWIGQRIAMVEKALAKPNED